MTYHLIMSEMVNFNVRGTQFNIPVNILQKKPDSLLYMLYATKLSVDKIDCSIYIDINPEHFCDVINYYNLDMYPDMQNNPYLYMDLNYLGLICDTHKNVSCIPFYMKQPLKNCYNQQIIKQQKKCNIHTIDNEVIVVDLMSYNTTIYCNKDCNEFTKIIFGMKQENIISISEEYIDVWIGVDKKIINNILSIIRDGIYWYYEFLVRHESHYNKIVIKYLFYFGICDIDVQNILINRINIVEEHFRDFVAADGGSYFFSEEEIKNRRCILDEDSPRCFRFYNLLKNIHDNRHRNYDLYYGAYYDTCKRINGVSNELCEKLTVSLTNYIYEKANIMKKN